MRTKGKMIVDKQDQDNYRQGYFAETRHEFETLKAPLVFYGDFSQS